MKPKWNYWKLLKKSLQKQPVAEVSDSNVYWERFQNENKMKLLKKLLKIIENFWKLLKKLLKKLLQKQPVAQVSGINVYWERFQNETKMKLLKKYLVT